MDDSTLLHVLGRTELMSSDQRNCDPYFSGGYYCWGVEYLAMKVHTTLLAPGSWPIQSSQDVDSSYAEASFSYYPPNAGGVWWGVWRADSDHEVQVRTYQEWCLFEEGIECECPSGFPFPCSSVAQWQYLGQTSDMVAVDPPPPPPPCESISVVDAEAFSEMFGWMPQPEPFERGARIFCQFGQVAVDSRYSSFQPPIGPCWGIPLMIHVACL